MSAIVPPDSTPVVSQSIVEAPPAEPGYLTTEFWATQAAAAVTLGMTVGADFGLFSLNTTQKTDVSMVAALAIVVAEGAYAIARNIRKKGTPG